jgi:hypothetical protein
LVAQKDRVTGDEAVISLCSLLIQIITL